MHKVNVCLYTSRFLDVTKDLIICVLAYLREDERIVFTIGDGQSDDDKREWIESRLPSSSERVKYIAEPSLWERVSQSLEVDAEWILWLADDDPVSVNYLRSLVDKACASDETVSAIFPAFYLSYSREKTYALRYDDIDQATQGERLARLFFAVSHNGLFSYSLMRRHLYCTFHDYIRQRPIQPSYCDHLISSLLAMKGKLLAAKENVSVLLRDDSVWYQTDSETQKDASLYPHSEMVLFHDLFWMADLLNLLRANGLDEDAYPTIYNKIRMHFNVLVERFQLRLAKIGTTDPQRATRCLERMRPLLERCKQQELKNTAVYAAFFDEVVKVATEVQDDFIEGGATKTDTSSSLVTTKTDANSGPNADFMVVAEDACSVRDYVNVCVITYNRLEFTKQALESLFRYADYPHVVTVVDNGSSDGSVDYLKDLHAAGKIKNLVLFDRNMGVAKAANVGWDCEPEAAYYVKYDNDVVMQGPWLAEMVDIAKSIQAVGTVGYNVEPYSYPLSFVDGRWVRIKANGNLGGACKLIPCEVHRKFGYWSEEYGLYGEEDADYGYRILFGGLLNVYMANEDLAFHLPAGKAAIIDPVTFEARDGAEEVVDADYRRWKDQQRKLNASRDGLFLRNLYAYKNKSKPLYAGSRFVPEWRSGRHALYEYMAHENGIVREGCHSAPESAGTGPKNVVVYSSEAVEWACAQIRLLQPFKYLSNGFLLHWAVKRKSTDDGYYSDLSMLQTAEMVVMQRFYVQSAYSSYIDLALGCGRPVIYELDDLLFDPPPENPHYQSLSIERNYILSIIDRVDAVIVSTAALADAVREYANPKKVFVLNNAVDVADSLSLPATRNGPVRIAMTGSTTHKQDYALVEAALLRIAKKYGNKVQLVFVGDIPDRLRNHPASTFVNHVDNYGLYSRKFSKFEFDIALVPLEDNRFNRCKSNIKWLEYSAAGVAGIYSDLEPYAEVRHGETGLKVANTTEAWFAAIRDLIDHPEKRLAIAKAAQAEVLAKHTAELRAKDYARVYGEILAAHEKSTEGGLPIPVESNQPGPEQLYEVWQAAHAPQPRDAEWVAERMEGLADRPVFHIGVIALSETEAGLAETIKSFGRQFYPDWRLTIVAESPAPAALGDMDKIAWLCPPEDIPMLTALNAAFLETPADWVGMIESGDRLAPHALFALAEKLDRHTDWQLVYSDEDSLDAEGRRDLPFFKTDFNLEMLRAAPFTLGGLMALRRDLFADLSGYQPELEGAESYDLVLRAWERIGTTAVGHIADILYHRHVAGGHSRREIEIVQMAKRVALDEHFLRLGIKADLEDGRLPGSTRVRYRHEGTPLVSIVVPTRNQVHFLQRCLESLIEKTVYTHYEILVVDNGSDEGQTLNYLKLLRQAPTDRMRVIDFPGPFNFSAMNNLAAREARGEYLVLLNNDTAVLEGDWLDEMLSYARLPDVGIVGARLLFPNGTIQHAGVILGINDAPADHPFVDHPANDPGYFGRLALPQELTAVTAACMMIRKSVFEEVGGLDEGEFKVSYNDVDLCIKTREKGHRVVWTPYATLLHEGSASQTKPSVEQAKIKAKQERFRAERDAIYWKWPRWIAFDPAYNRNLSVNSSDFLVEIAPALSWDPEWRPRPRILAHPADRMGCGEYRMIAPMRALNAGGRVMGWETGKYLSIPELLRMQPDSLVFQRQVEWSQIELMENYIKHSKAFRVFEIDDLLTNVPIQNVRKKLIVEQKDIVKRFRKAASLCHRFVVSTEFLAEEYKDFTDEVIAIPNYLERTRWGGFTPLRRQGEKPRVGWAGSVTHDGDLAVILDVVKATAEEVDWVFFGMCPKPIRPYVREFHEPVPLEDYAAKLASLNLDLAVAPLEDVPFNHAKSHLRLLEYGVLGYPVICTDLTPYRGAYPVTRLPNRYKDWVEAIREHVSDLDELARRGDALREHINAHWILEDHLDVWSKAWLPS